MSLLVTALQHQTVFGGLAAGATSQFALGLASALAGSVADGSLLGALARAG